MATSFIVRSKALLRRISSEMSDAAAEIYELGREQRVDDHVLRLEVAMRDALGEEEAQTLGGLVGELQLGLETHRLARGQQRVDVLLVGGHVYGVALVPGLLDHQEVAGHERVGHVAHVLQERQLVAERVHRSFRLPVAHLVCQSALLLLANNIMMPHMMI